jgi:hypothetical protein
MTQHLSHIFAVAQYQSHVLVDEWVDAVRMLLRSLLDLRSAFSSDDLPIAFILGIDTPRAARTLGRRWNQIVAPDRKIGSRWTTPLVERRPDARSTLRANDHRSRTNVAGLR